MSRPRHSRRDREADPNLDPDDVSDVHPAELRRLQKEFFSRVDHLVAAFARKRRAAGLDADPPPPSPDAAAPEV